MSIFDGRPNRSRLAADRLYNPSVGRDWIDLIPSRRTAAVIGVLNVRDCDDTDALMEAERELRDWVGLYTVPPYERTTNAATGSKKAGASAAAGGPPEAEKGPTAIERIVTRMFVFDSFDEACQRNVDLSKTSLGSNMVAFPPSDAAHTHMMDLHLNVVVNDLAVAIFRRLENGIRESDALAKAAGRREERGRGGRGGGGGGGGGGGSATADDAPSSSNAVGLSIANIASIVNPNNDLYMGDDKNKGTDGKGGNGGGGKHDRSSKRNVSGGDDKGSGGIGSGAAIGGLKAVVAHAAKAAQTAIADRTKPTLSAGYSQLLTPLDGPLAVRAASLSNLTAREADAVKRRDIGRREKLAADLSLLAGSPIDAYERYTRAAELTKSSHDPLWYAASLEGCAASFVAMAEAGGHCVDEYLENNFQLPEEIMNVAAAAALASGGSADARKAAAVDRTKTTLPAAVFALAEESLGVTCRHPLLAPLHAELLLKLASYTSEVEETHVRCRWGEGEGCYGGGSGDGMSSSGDDREEPKRWETTSVASLDLRELEGKSGTDLGVRDSCRRAQKFAGLLHRAASAGGLDGRTRADVAATCARASLKGVKATKWGSYGEGPYARLRLPRKAAFFATVAAEAMSACPGSDSALRAASLWLAASRLYSRDGNRFVGSGSNYTWATLRASILQALSLRGDHVAAETAAELLLVLLSEISPDRSGDASVLAELSSAADMDDESTLPSNSRHDVDVPIDDRSRHSEMTVGTTATGAANEQARHLEQAVESLDARGGAPPDLSGSKHSKHGGGGGGGRRAAAPMQGRGPSFFAQVGGLTPLTIAQSKWLDDDPLPSVQLPLVDPSLLVDGRPDDGKGPAPTDPSGQATQPPMPLVAMNCVIHKIRFETCALAQRRCIASVSDLRQETPTSSSPANPGRRGGDPGVFSIYGGSRSGGAAGGAPSSPSVPPPLEVATAQIVKSESHLLLDRTKAAGYSGKTAGTSMATFFNPYAKKKAEAESKGKTQPILVAEGEERTVLVEFGNRLSVPLEVPSCQLEFDDDDGGADRVEAPPLSFTVPAKAKKFAVHFPFIVIARRRDGGRLDERDGGGGGGEPEDAPTPVPPPGPLANDIFEATGLRVACLNRSFSIPFGKQDEPPTPDDGGDDAERPAAFGKQLPPSASIYQRSPHNRPKKREENLSVRLESVPAQPNLLVSFTTSQTPIDDNTTVPVHLSDGEIYTIPPFRLENDFGPCGLGRMERLQIAAVGLPGLPDEILYDTDLLAAAREDEEEDLLTDTDESESSETEFEEMMECDGLPPLKMKALAEGLSLRSINDKTKSAGEGSIVTFQMAATHDMGNQLANGGNVRIRFRYRGPSPNVATEIWRKREVSLRIVRVKGPRISSLTFRSDLSWGSAYAELCRSLASQRRRWEAYPKWESGMLLRRRASATSGTGSPPTQGGKQGFFDDGEDPADESILHRVGMDQGVHVSGNEVVVLMAVANETNSTIVLSNRKGLVGGFEGSPMPTVRVTSGVSVKIPVVIPRIDRLDENNEVVDIAAELVARTALQWQAEVGEGVEAVNKRVRQGRVRIPSRCLREIIDEHQSFASRICKPPVSVKVGIGRKDDEKEMVVSLGMPVEATVEVLIQDWVPPSALSNCSITLEFCAARKDSGANVLSEEEERRTAYVWCGQLRRTVGAEEANKSHVARVAFFQYGTFVVSACAKLSGGGGGEEETWWAPHAETVQVEKVL